MDPLSMAAGAELVKMGLPGIVILGLIYFLWSERAAHRRTRDKLDQVQDQRVLDAASQNKAMALNTSATEAGTKATETMARAIESLTNTILSMRGGAK